MKKIRINLLLCIWVFTGFYSSAQNQKNSDEFLFAIVELQKLGSDDQFDVDFKLTKVVSDKLRIPTKSEIIPRSSANYLRVQITDDSNNVLDEITFNDPFNVTREYVNEDGQLAQITTQENSRSILIRRPISSKATSLNITSNSSQRSATLFTQKFR